MKINRYRWTPAGMVFDPQGEWMSNVTHTAIVAVQEQERSLLISANIVQVASLEDEVDRVTKATPISLDPSNEVKP